jgi:hypothetical protein
MTTPQNRAHVTFAFFGDYRPVSFTGKTTTEAVINALAAISDPRIADKLKALAWQFVQENKGKGRVVSMSSESYDCGPIAIGIASRPHEPWLGKLVAAMPEFPAIDYPKGVSPIWENY